MAEGVGADPLRDAGRLHRYTDGLLHGMFVDVAATHNAAKGVHREPINGNRRAGPPHVPRWSTCRLEHWAHRRHRSR